MDFSAAASVAEAPLLETPLEQTTHEVPAPPIQASHESSAAHENVAPADFHSLPVLAELGPLPGESLSKYQMRPPLVDQHEDLQLWKNRRPTSWKHSRGMNITTMLTPALKFT